MFCLSSGQYIRFTKKKKKKNLLFDLPTAPSTTTTHFTVGSFPVSCGKAVVAWLAMGSTTRRSVEAKVGAKQAKAARDLPDSSDESSFVAAKLR
jgi:hypothetical protein